jgi:hypothetical protein
MVLRFVPALMTKHLSALKVICHLLSYFCNMSTSSWSLLGSDVIHNHILEVVEESSKYLGVTISKDLIWNAHINKITNKANKTLGFMKQFT